MGQMQGMGGANLGGRCYVIWPKNVRCVGAAWGIPVRVWYAASIGRSVNIPAVFVVRSNQCSRFGGSVIFARGLDTCFLQAGWMYDLRNFYGGE